MKRAATTNDTEAQVLMMKDIEEFCS